MHYGKCNYGKSIMAKVVWQMKLSRLKLGTYPYHGLNWEITLTMVRTGDLELHLPCSKVWLILNQINL